MKVIDYSGTKQILDKIFYLFLSIDDQALNSCGGKRLVKRIFQLCLIVHQANFTNAPTKPYPRAWIEIFTMCSTVTFPPRISKALKIKSRVEHIIRY